MSSMLDLLPSIAFASEDNKQQSSTNDNKDPDTDANDTKCTCSSASGAGRLIGGRGKLHKEASKLKAIQKSKKKRESPW